MEGKKRQKLPVRTGLGRCFWGAWIFFAGERRYWPGRARSAWQRDWRGRGVGANSYGGSDKARGVRSHLPPAILAAREASHPCRLAVMLAGPFPYRACCVRVAYSSFSTAVQVPSAAERENGCALIPCVVLVGFRLAGGKLLHMAGVDVVNRALCRRPPWRSCGVPALRERLRAPVRWQGPASLERQEKNSLFTAGWSVLPLKRESARCGIGRPAPNQAEKTYFSAT